MGCGTKEIEDDCPSEKTCELIRLCRSCERVGWKGVAKKGLSPLNFDI